MKTIVEINNSNLDKKQWTCSNKATINYRALVSFIIYIVTGHNLTYVPFPRIMSYNTLLIIVLSYVMPHPHIH